MDGDGALAVDGRPQADAATQRWPARPRQAVIWRTVALVVPLAAILVVARVLFAVGIRATSILVASVTVAAAAALAWWLRGRGGQATEVVLDGGRLTIAGAGQHLLGPGSLHAVRSLVMGSGSATFGTVVFVRLDTGRTVTLMLYGLLPDALYAGEAQSGADYYLEPEARALLAPLKPFLMPRDPAADASADAYAMVLRGRAGGAANMHLTIAGDRVTLRDATGALVAEAAAPAIAATLYAHERLQGYRAPRYPAAPAVQLQWPSPGPRIGIGADPPDLEHRWAHLPHGPAPEHTVGFGELMTLLDALSVSR